MPAPLVVGIVAGLGEFIGYALRLVSGYLADRLGKYWPITFVGYALNLFAVPLLALAGSWEVAALLILMERMGKAIRTPARDAMLSHATTEVGRGWGFGFHEAMDQIGAMSGPLIVAAVLYFNGGYRAGFAYLLIPAILAVLVITIAARLYPHPQHLEVSAPKLETTGLTRPYWLYVVAVGLIGAGYADFPLIAYHFGKAAVASAQLDSHLLCRGHGRGCRGGADSGPPVRPPGNAGDHGRLQYYRRFLLPWSFWEALISPCWAWFSGASAWGAQESIIKAALADMVPRDRRATGYGIFNTGFGLFWFLGSALMGILYDFSLGSLIFFSVIIQLGSIPIFLKISKEISFVHHQNKPL